jgi:hypothetical protein
VQRLRASPADVLYPGLSDRAPAPEQDLGGALGVREADAMEWHFLAICFCGFILSVARPVQKIRIYKF